MNTSGEVADLMVKEALMITEEAIKLSGLGVKNLAAIVVALLNDKDKTQGKTAMKKLLKSGEPICIMQIKEKDLKRFDKEANNYGVLYVPVGDKTNDSGLCDIIAKQKDVTQLNYIMERLGYTTPIKEEPEPEPEPEKETDAGKDKDEKKSEEPSKNPSPRKRENPQEKESTKCGDTEKGDNHTDKKPSVKKKVEDIKAEQKKARAEKMPERKKQARHSQPKKKKKKSYKKGKSR